jgi:integrase
VSEHVLKFRDHLEANGYSGSNVAQHLAKLQALFDLALSEGIVKLNPAHKIKARKAAKLSGGKQGFDAAQMKRVLAALDGETADFQWIVKLLAFHGARSSEICQLKCGDVAKLSGVDVFRIHDQNGSVKNRQSVRDVPLHPKCKAIIAHATKRGADAWYSSLPSF